jgi:DNA-binding LytR/AlgR family response regulator
MRLNDAEQLMPDGVRVHRSWWVAAGAVDEIRKIDRQTVLQLIRANKIVSLPHSICPFDRWIQ